MKKTVLVISLVCAVLVVAILGLAGLATYLGYKQTALLSQPPEHGTEFIIQADWSQMRGGTNVFSIVKEPLRKRFSNFGTRIFMEPVSASQIRVVAPITRAVDVEAISNLLSHRGWLEFRLVHPDSDALIKRGEVPPGYEVLQCEKNGPDGRKQVEKVVVKKEPINGLTGGIIKNATVGRGNLGEPQVDFALNAESADTFAKMTRENIGRRLAIVLDGQLYSAPRINGEIDGNGEITGQFTLGEAQMLANLLNNALPVPITVLKSRTF